MDNPQSEEIGESPKIFRLSPPSLMDISRVSKFFKDMEIGLIPYPIGSKVLLNRSNPEESLIEDISSDFDGEHVYFEYALTDEAWVSHKELSLLSLPTPEVFKQLHSQTDEDDDEC